MTRWGDFNFQAMRAAEAMSCYPENSPEWLKFKKMKEEAEKYRDMLKKEV